MDDNIVAVNFFFADRHSNLVGPVVRRAVRRLHVALQTVAHAGAVVLVLAVQRDVSDRPPGPSAPLFVAGLGLGQQLRSGQRDDDRARRGGQQDRDDAHHHDRPGVLHVLRVFVVGGHLQYGRTQSCLEAIPIKINNIICDSDLCYNYSACKRYMGRRQQSDFSIFKRKTISQKLNTTNQNITVNKIYIISFNKT